MRFAYHLLWKRNGEGDGKDNKGKWQQLSLQLRIKLISRRVCGDVILFDLRLSPLFLFYANYFNEEMGSKIFPQRYFPHSTTLNFPIINFNSQNPCFGFSDDSFVAMRKTKSR